MRSRSYVIVSWPETGGPVQIPSHRPGRHRMGAPGATRRPTGGPHRRPFRCRGRHRHVEKRSVLAARYGTLVVMLGTVAVSGWFTATGAAAFAQMVQP